MIQCYIQNCHFCKYAKAPKNWYNSLLKPLPISSHFWTDVILDFVTSLLINNGYNVILIIVDCLIKKRYYIPYTIDENNIITETIAQLLLQNIWKLYVLLSLLTSDKGPHFISRV